MFNVLGHKQTANQKDTEISSQLSQYGYHHKYLNNHNVGKDAGKNGTLILS
jgi:hypothetical protein